MIFDPEGTFTINSGIFGLPKNENAKLHLLPFSWEPTASFKKGTSLGPEALFEATKQMDLFHPYFKKIYENGILWHEETLELSKRLDDEAKLFTKPVVEAIVNEQPEKSSELKDANQLSDIFNNLVYTESKKLLQQGKKIGLVGGDHSCPFGLIKALSEKHDEFSIVHIDAHFDFRKAYQGFEHSHASIMYNVRTKLAAPPKIFQLGIRDFAESEFLFAQKNSTFILDSELQTELIEGANFSHLLDKLFKNLTENIYLSFDIDGLSPEYCPNTGTPVPGGLSFSQAQYLTKYLHQKGHKLIGFDLVEVAPENPDALGDGHDEIIAARILYDMCCFALA